MLGLAGNGGKGRPSSDGDDGELYGGGGGATGDDNNYVAGKGAQGIVKVWTIK